MTNPDGSSRMFVMHALRRRLAVGAVAATTGLGLLAFAGLPAAQAGSAPATGAVSTPSPTPSPSPTAPTSPTGLHITGAPVKLPGSPVVTDFSEAPNGSVYYASGSSVYVVSGSSASHVLKVKGTVLAVAANSSDLFVAVGRTVREYNSAHAAVRSWTLKSSHVPTAAGLYAIRGTVWAWTDYAVDGGSLNYANVYRFSTSSAVVHRVSTAEAYPAEMAADSAGAYYQAEIKNTSYLVRVTSSGAVSQVRASGIGVQLALSGSRVEFLAYHVSGTKSSIYLDSYNQVTLAHDYSRRASSTDRDIAGTGAGLLLLSSSCGSLACSSAQVSQLSGRNGATESKVKVTDALALVAGPAAAVITYRSHAYYLVRLAA